MKETILNITITMPIRLPFAADTAHSGSHATGGTGRPTDEQAAWKQSPSWTTASIDGRGGSCMSAATTTAATALRWMTATSAFASRVFLTPCCAVGFAPPSCRWIRRWKRPCSTGARPKGAPCAGPYSCPAPIGPSIARIAPNGSAAARRPRGSGKDTTILRI